MKVVRDSRRWAALCRPRQSTHGARAALLPPQLHHVMQCRAHLGARDVAAAHDLQLESACGRHAGQAQVQALQRQGSERMAGQELRMACPMAQHARLAAQHRAGRRPGRQAGAGWIVQPLTMPAQRRAAHLHAAPGGVSLQSGTLHVHIRACSRAEWGDPTVSFQVSSAARLCLRLEAASHREPRSTALPRHTTTCRIAAAGAPLERARMVSSALSRL